MRRIKIAVVAVVFAAVPILGAQPASAMTCAPDFEVACSVVAKVVCGVLAKGRPCLA
jgi:hypothetical protein